VLDIRRLARRDPGRAGGFEKWLIDLQELYGNRVVPVTAAIARVRGRLNAGDPLPVADGLMAATALVHGWTFVTRNTADVVQTAVRLINPFGVDQ
jgi:predicted nucleic acid-binding protein